MNNDDDYVIEARKLPHMSLEKLQIAANSRVADFKKRFLVAAVALILAFPLAIFFRPIIGGNMPLVIYAMPTLFVAGSMIGTGMKCYVGYRGIQEEISSR